MKILFIILVGALAGMIEILIRTVTNNQSKKNKFDMEMIIREIAVDLRNELCQEMRQLSINKLSETNEKLDDIESNIMVEMGCLSAKHDKDIQEIKEKIKVGKKSKRIVQLINENKSLKNEIQKLEEQNKLLKERNEELEERNVLQLKYIKDSNRLFLQKKETNI